MTWQTSLNKLLGQEDCHLYSGRELEASSGANNHPDERMHMKIGDFRIPKPDDWKHVHLMGEIGKGAKF